MLSMYIDTPRISLMDSIANPKGEMVEGWGVGVHSLVHNTLGVEALCVGALGWGLMKMTSKAIIHTSHKQTQTHKTHHNPDLGEATTFPPIVFSVPGHGANTQMSFCPRTPKLEVSKNLKLGFSRFWRPITLCEDLQLKWGLKQSCSPCRKISNGMWHAMPPTCKEIRAIPNF